MIALTHNCCVIASVDCNCKLLDIMAKCVICAGPFYALPLKCDMDTHAEIALLHTEVALPARRDNIFI